MATFELGKDLSEITEPELLEDDWYQMRIVKEPKAEPNKAKRDKKTVAEGAGDNIVLRLRVMDEDPEKNGRPFTKWISLPSPGDDERFVEMGPQAGMTVQDAKLWRIRSWAAAFSGFKSEDFEGESVDFEVGDEAMVYVTTGVDFRDEERMVNEIDMNEDPRPVS